MKVFVCCRSWREVGSTETLEMPIDQLIESNQYLVRVTAENAYGVSDPAELTEPFTAKSPYSKSSSFQKL